MNICSNIVHPGCKRSRYVKVQLWRPVFRAGEAYWTYRVSLANEVISYFASSWWFHPGSPFWILVLSFDCNLMKSRADVKTALLLFFLFLIGIVNRLIFFNWPYRIRMCICISPPSTCTYTNVCTPRGRRVEQLMLID